MSGCIKCGGKDCYAGTSLGCNCGDYDEELDEQESRIESLETEVKNLRKVCLILTAYLRVTVSHQLAITLERDIRSIE